MQITCHRILALLIFVNFGGLVTAQVVSNAPFLFVSGTSINFNFFSRHSSRSDNSMEIRHELLDTNVILFIAHVNGLKASDLATIQIASGSEPDSVGLYQIRKPDKTFKIMDDQLNAYAQQRAAGHTKEFLFAALTNHLKAASITNLYLRAILTNQPWVPVNRLVKEASETYTNRAGEILSVASFTTITNGKEETVWSTNCPSKDTVMLLNSYSVVDGPIGWRYSFSFYPDGQIENSDCSRCDPMDLDSKYASLIKQVDDEVEAEIKRKTIHGLGTIHYFWDRKKEILKQKGFNWHSPSELNPGTIYD
jgi:hypothetical protein